MTTVAVAATVAGAGAEPGFADKGGGKHFHVEATYSTTPVGPIPPCPPGQLRILGNGAAQGTQIGHGTWQSGECADFASMPGFIVVNGTATLTAANGDQVSFRYAVSTPFPDATGAFHARGTYVITGGTGRFAGATGGGAISADGNTITLIETAVLDGAIHLAHGHGDGGGGGDRGDDD